jgi:hypothetical protein
MTQRGGFVLGLVVGLLIGLALALAWRCTSPRRRCPSSTRCRSAPPSRTRPKPSATRTGTPTRRWRPGPAPSAAGRRRTRRTGRGRPAPRRAPLAAAAAPRDPGRHPGRQVPPTARPRRPHRRARPPGQAGRAGADPFLLRAGRCLHPPTTPNSSAPSWHCWAGRRSSPSASRPAAPSTACASAPSKPAPRPMQRIEKLQAGGAWIPPWCGVERQ